MKTIKLALALLISCGSAGTALAQVPAEQQAPQATQQLSPAQQAARARYMQDMNRAAQFPLSPDFLTRMTQTMNQIRAANLQPPDSSNLTLDQTISRVSSIAGLPAILKANGFTAHDFVMGLTCFGMTSALMNQTNRTNGPTLNPANVALLKTNPQQVQLLIQAMGGGQQQ